MLASASWGALGCSAALLFALGCQEEATDPADPVVATARAEPMNGATPATSDTGASNPPASGATKMDCARLPNEGCVRPGGLGSVAAPSSGATGAVAAGGGDAGAPASAAAPDAAAPAAMDPPSLFNPCPGAGAPCVIMPFGDSITEGFPTFDGGYRVELFHQALLGGHPITFVGDRANGPQTVDGQVFPRGSEGYSGYTIDESSRAGITVRAEPAIATYQPHIILLMIGTNDIDQNIDVANAPARLGVLIDRITAAAPQALLVVAQILPTTNAVTNQRFQAYDAAIPAQVASRIAAGKHVIGVDMYAAFTSNPAYATAYMVDALHPNPAGYALLGQTWYTTIRPYLR